MPRQLAVLCLVLLINLGEAHFLEPAASPPKPKKAAGVRQCQLIEQRGTSELDLKASLMCPVKRPAESSCCCCLSQRAVYLLGVFRGLELTCHEHLWVSCPD